MKWFDQWFARKCRWAWENNNKMDLVLEGNSKQSLTVTQDEAWEDGLRINIKKMIGGSVVSCRTYKKRADRSDTRNYIITDEQDFNVELSKIITLKSMRQS